MWRTRNLNRCGKWRPKVTRSTTLSCQTNKRGESLGKPEGAAKKSKATLREERRGEERKCGQQMLNAEKWRDANQPAIKIPTVVTYVEKARDAADLKWNELSNAVVKRLCYVYLLWKYIYNKFKFYLKSQPFIILIHPSCRPRNYHLKLPDTGNLRGGSEVIKRSTSSCQGLRYHSVNSAGIV